MVEPREVAKATASLFAWIVALVIMAAITVGGGGVALVLLHNGMPGLLGVVVGFGFLGIGIYAADRFYCGVAKGVGFEDE